MNPAKSSSTSPLRATHPTNAILEQKEAFLDGLNTAATASVVPASIHHLKSQSIKSTIPMSPTDKFISPCSRKIFSDRIESKKKSSTNPLSKRFEELKNEYSVKKEAIKHHLSTQTNATPNDENTLPKD